MRERGIKKSFRDGIFLSFFLWSKWGWNGRLLLSSKKDEKICSNLKVRNCGRVATKSVEV